MYIPVKRKVDGYVSPDWFGEIRLSVIIVPMELFGEGRF